MLKFIEQAKSSFNRKQLQDGKLENQTVKIMFEKLGQSLWYQDGDKLFREYLDKLKDCAHFKRDVESNVSGNTHTDLDNSANIPE